MNLNPIWHTVSFDIEGLTKYSSLPHVTTLVPCDNDNDARVYINEVYLKKVCIELSGREIINLKFKD